jgi:hypothetical protein
MALLAGLALVVAACGTTQTGIQPQPTATSVPTATSGPATTTPTTPTTSPTATPAPPTSTPAPAGYPVLVYFAKHPDTDTDPTKVFPVQRIAPSLQVATLAVDQMLAGPSAVERAQGYYSPFDGQLGLISYCPGPFKSFTITLDHRGNTPEPGTATLQFCRRVDIPGELAGARMTSMITATLTQFPTIKRIAILTFSGNCFNDLQGENRCLVPASGYAAPYVITTYGIGQTSSDGPALWTSPTGAVRAEIAWTGTDAGHHLNVMTSADGVTFGNQVVLAEASPYRPALARYGTDASDAIALAWVGTDASHSLNVLSGVPGNGYQKLTLKESSLTAPALALNGGTFYLVWTSADASHALNVLPIIWRGGLAVGTKMTLTQFRSSVRPSISVDPKTNQLLLSWTATDGRIHVATSPDGVNWTEPDASRLGEWSDVGPSMMSFATTGMPGYFLAWRGVDPAHSLNVRFTTSFPAWSTDGQKSTLYAFTFGGPALGYVGGDRRVLVAWTDTDAAHTLRIAGIGV